jgi:hypothetical protein
MSEAITYVGLDAHQDRIYAAVLLEGIAKPVEDHPPNGNHRAVNAPAPRTSPGRNSHVVPWIDLPARGPE